jgi:hypothetical protein
MCIVKKMVDNFLFVLGVEFAKEFGVDATTLVLGFVINTCFCVSKNELKWCFKEYSGFCEFGPDRDRGS